MGMTELHRSFLEEASGKLRGDDRIVGLLAGGSMLEGTMDEYSDLDLVVVYAERYREQIMAQRLEIAGRLGPLLSGFTGEHVGEPRVVICLYGPPVLHVDLKFVSPDELRVRVENPLVLWEKGSAISSLLGRTEPNEPAPDEQWIEDRFWVWLHYGAVKLGRGELFETIDHLTYIRGTVLGPLLSRRGGRKVRGVRKVEQLDPAASAALKRTVPSHDRGSCFQALVATVELYRSLRATGGSLRLRSEAEKVAIAYLNDIEKKISP